MHEASRHFSVHSGGQQRPALQEASAVLYSSFYTVVIAAAAIVLRHHGILCLYAELQTNEWLGPGHLEVLQFQSLLGGARIVLNTWPMMYFLASPALKSGL